MIEILKSWFKLLVARQFTTTNVDCFGLAQTLWYRVLLTLVWSSDHKCQSSLWKYEMTQNPRRSSRIARCAVNHGARPAMTFQVAIKKINCWNQSDPNKKNQFQTDEGKERHLHCGLQCPNTPERRKDTWTNRLSWFYKTWHRLYTRTQIYTRGICNKRTHLWQLETYHLLCMEEKCEWGHWRNQFTKMHDRQVCWNKMAKAISGPQKLRDRTNVL